MTVRAPIGTLGSDLTGAASGKLRPGSRPVWPAWSGPWTTGSTPGSSRSEASRPSTAIAKVVTGLGDHGIMWAATTVWRARRTGPGTGPGGPGPRHRRHRVDYRQPALKAVVGRSRPDPGGLGLTAAGVPVREPTSSSFPSGHTLAAFCAVTVMSQRGDRAGNALLFTSATLVGLSRLHLRAHHASDVLGGAAIGMALGLVGRRLL